MGEPQGAVMDERNGASPTFGTSHPVLPAGPPQQDERELQDAMDSAGMGIIPPAGYPEMEVHQVSDADEKRILESLNPRTIGSVEGAGDQEMNIAPVSEQEAQEILRSSTQSIGRSREGSLP